MYNLALADLHIRMTQRIATNILVVTLVMCGLAWWITLQPTPVRETLLPMLIFFGFSTWLGRRCITEMPKMVAIWSEPGMEPFRGRIVMLGMTDAIVLTASVLTAARIVITLLAMR